MTRPTKSPAEAEGINAPEVPNSAAQPGTTAETHLDDQQIAWLRAGPEVFTAPVTQFRSKQLIGLSALAIVVAGLAVATTVFFLAQDSQNRPDSEQITAPLTTTPPQVRTTPPDVLAANPAPATPPAPMPTIGAPATIPEAPMMTPAAPKPPGQVSTAATSERRSTNRREPLASTGAPAPAPPVMTAARRPSSADLDGDQASAAQPAPTAQPCSTDCTEPTLTRTPTSWTPQRP